MPPNQIIEIKGEIEAIREKLREYGLESINLDASKLAYSSRNMKKLTKELKAKELELSESYARDHKDLTINF